MTTKERTQLVGLWKKYCIEKQDVSIKLPQSEKPFQKQYSVFGETIEVIASELVHDFLLEKINSD